MTSRTLSNRRQRRQLDGLPGVPQLPADILAAGNQVTEEQERTGNAVIQAATWRIHALKQERGLAFKEDRREPALPREFTTVGGTRDLIVRAVA